MRRNPERYYYADVYDNQIIANAVVYSVELNRLDSDVSNRGKRIENKGFRISGIS